MRYSKIKIFNFDIFDITKDPEKIEKEVNEFCSKHAVRDIKIVPSKERVDIEDTCLYQAADAISFIIFYNETY